MIERLAEQGATWVQLDEPCFVEDRTEQELDALRLAYEELCKVHERPRILVKTYFDHVGRRLRRASRPADRGRRPRSDRRRRTRRRGSPRTSTAAGTTPSSSPSRVASRIKWLFAGIVDGRNVWINHLEHSLDALEGLREPHRPARRLDQLLAAAHPDRPRRRARPTATPTSTTRRAPGWRSPCRRWARWRPSPRGSPRGARRSPTSSTPMTARTTPAASPTAPATRRYAPGSRR